MPRTKRSPRVLGPYRRERRTRVSWELVLVAANGQRRYQLFASRQSADRAKTEIEKGLAERRIDTATAIDLFLGDCSARGLADSTIASYRCACAAFFPSSVPLQSLSTETCQAIYAGLQERYSVRSHQLYLSKAKLLLRWCVEHGYLEENPLTGVKPLGKPGPGYSRLAIGEIRQWDAKAHELAAAGRDWAVAALFTLWLGERASEVVAAQVRHVAERLQPGDTIQIVDSKTESGHRILEVAPPLCEYVARLCEGKQLGDYLWPSTRSRSGHHDRGWVRAQVKRICRLAGVPEVCAHAMRGSHATLGALTGQTSQALAAQLGHRTPLVTERHYIGEEALHTARSRRAMLVLQGGQP